MKFKLIVTFCFIVGLVFGSDGDPDKKHTTSTFEATTITSKSDPSTKPTTLSTTTTAPSTTSIPTTTSPSSTTSTTAHPTSSTTSTPSTTPTSTTPSPTLPSTTPTTPPPTPPTPKNNMWVVKDPKTNYSCILAKMDVTFDIHSGKSENKMTVSPATSKAVEGHCGTPVEVLKVIWANDNLNSSMELWFNITNKSYHVSGINLTLSWHNTSAGNAVFSQFFQGNLSLYETNLNKSYSCASADIPLLKNSKNETVDIKISNLLIEAFRKHNNTEFSASHFCSGEVPDIVPLVVGIALAGLVLVVVIAYLIGRRRSQARGYLSM